ncbi:TetR/AcrR family transcriptional regulator C-terminal domain-containing protein [Corallococcus sp. M34]|nr:TetR/AcrR family transcriptional regulator C-terminal domain-containing protein [Citreicoccus inhibens]
MPVSTPTPAPYLRIAGELRRRIASGALAPGARLPSTRQIARKWRVALATATKALNVLQQEGLVRGEPRVGIVVLPRGASTPPAPPPQPEDPERGLTRERIVRVAIEMADAEGLSALSMRGVASRLEVSTMSSYRHVRDKEELVLLMADAAFGAYVYPQVPPEGWRAQLELAGRALWSLFRRHPWLAQLSPLSRPLPLPGLLAHAEWSLRALKALRLEGAALLDAHVLLFSHMQGLASNLEREAQAEAATGLSDDQWGAAHEPALKSVAESGRFPVFAALLRELPAEGYTLNLDALFEQGMKALLDGFAHSFARRKRRAAK